jgi:pimeloyl-ACP methyl ester carboxylesterase
LRLQITIPIVLSFALTGCTVKTMEKKMPTNGFAIHIEQLTVEMNDGGPARWFVLIEGDGAAWPTPTRPPIDPTPENSAVLELAKTIHQRSKSNVLYLARPCQYPKTTGIKCHLKDWTTDRFATKHVDTLLGAVTQNVPKGAQVTLFGHSGGGVMALQLAGRLGDEVAIRKIVITGTPVDVSEWTRANGFSDLTVENYLDSLRALAARTVPVFALFGDLDSVVPEKYMRIAAEAGLSIQTRELTNTSHGQLARSETTLEILLDP